MSTTFKTWGGKPLPDGYKIQPVLGRSAVLHGPDGFIGAWDCPGGKAFRFLSYSYICIEIAWVVSIFPNAAPEYIQWCHEQGIEVPGGEIKRVEYIYQPDQITIDLDEDENGNQIYIGIFETIPIPRQLVDASGDWCPIVKPNVTATLTLEVKP